MTSGSSERCSGVVVSFDAHVGLGHVRADDGRSFMFHCIVIADGSRSIEIGTRVSFSLMSKLGRLEANDLRSV
jgi:cold shock CspA family protein